MKREPEDHPIADFFPLLKRRSSGRDEFRDLTNDIKSHGLREPITLFEGKILDGRNRARACELAKVVPRFEEFTGDDPVAFVVSKNLRRRHLSISQRAMIAAKISTFTWGGDRRKRPFGHLKEGHGHARAVAAAGFDVGYRTVTRAAKVRKMATPELVKAVVDGKVTLARAERIARDPKNEQIRHLKKRTAPKPLPSLEKLWLNAAEEERIAFVHAIGLEDFWLRANANHRQAWLKKRRQSGGFV